ncbi:MAG: hypothetical protein V4553_16125 [Bacteroidota bacterium]
MNLVNAYYKFELIQEAYSNHCAVNRLQKVGNNSCFNKLFSQELQVKFRRLNPKGIANDYVLYSLEFKNQCESKIFLFETALYMHPYGIVNVAESKHCIYFKECERNVFEVFIADASVTQSQRAHFLTRLIDGSLNEDIDELLNKIPNHEN